MPAYFVDTSALAKLYHTEIGSQQVEALAAEPDARLIVSQLSLVEIQSVFAGKVRTGIIDPLTLQQLNGLFFADLAVGRYQVVLVAGRHFRSAERLIRLHAVGRALRTLDSLQLAVALDLHQGGFVAKLVAADKHLCEVAALEGLGVINPLHAP